MPDDSLASLQPRSVLITGATRGIGRAIAERFVAQGDRVATIARGTDVPDGVLAVAGDVRDAAALDAAFATIEAAHGPVEVLVANAGVTRDQLLVRMTDADFEDIVDINLSGAFRVVRRACMGMIRLRRGRIVLISSVAAMSGAPGQVNYSASKSGLIGIARSVSRELATRGITANVVAPGFIDTEMTRVLTPEFRENYTANVPMRRFGTVEEVAAVVEFLASPAASYITGAVVPVDGGVGMGN